MQKYTQLSHFCNDLFYLMLLANKWQAIVPHVRTNYTGYTKTIEIPAVFNKLSYLYGAIDDYCQQAY
ncbi:hypothetical protein HGH92_04230 [Chitinophaga varians]|uniref:Uncharacterized protein n=1 Tax=Chitinophaga varians TaxID=2202339 RepID=A0A847RRS4_9BACT|nr:hypothetical protein [Chitinophaga varians]NLR63507.1 hypothetical protein [Chitinophaga varians]